MRNDNLNNEYAAIGQHIREAHLERSVEIARILADAIDALGRGLAKVARFAGTVLASASQARDARTVEADALVGRSFIR